MLADLEAGRLRIEDIARVREAGQDVESGCHTFAMTTTLPHSNKSIVPQKRRVLGTLRGGMEHNLLNLSEKQIRKARAHFRGAFSEGVEVVWCGYSCADGGWFDWVERAGDAESLRWVAFADYGTDAGRGPAFCGRGGDRRELLWRPPGARQTGARGDRKSVV